MAEGKKSFIAYSDWRDTFDELPDEDAGKLIKHIFAYVNDENPKSDSVLIKAVFANIKSTLKRDLKKWDKQLKQRSEAGKKSAEVRSTKINDRSTVVNETVRNSTDSVNVSVSVNDTVNVTESVINRKKLSNLEFFNQSEQEQMLAIKAAKAYGMKFTIEQIKVEAINHDAIFSLQFKDADIRKWQQYFGYHFEKLKKNNPQASGSKKMQTKL